MAAEAPAAGEAERPIVGYVSGVFDMFHIGHLNIIMRARQQCDRLVVGVVTDEVVQATKRHAPVIPLAERLDIVRGLRDVDAVVTDPYADKFDSWRHVVAYDVIFKGDDWQGTSRAAELERRLAEVGARVTYFPYTAHTSSSLLRDVLTRLAHTPVEPHPDSGDVLPQVAAQEQAGRRALDAGLGGRAEKAPGRHCPACGQSLPRGERTPSRGNRTRVHLES